MSFLKSVVVTFAEADHNFDDDGTDKSFLLSSYAAATADKIEWDPVLYVQGPVGADQRINAKEMIVLHHFFTLKWCES